MRLEIDEEPRRKRDPIVRLKLESFGDSIQLKAVDENGDDHHCGNILMIHGDGTIERNLSVNKELGFELDGDGRVVMKYEDC